MIGRGTRTLWQAVGAAAVALVLLAAHPARSESGTTPVRHLVRQGEEHRLAGNIRAADAAFRQAIARTPQDSLAQDYAWTALGVLQANEGLAEAKDTLLAEALGFERAFGTEPIAHPFQVVALAHLARIIAAEPRAGEDAAIYAARAAAAARLPLMRALAESVVAGIDLERGRIDAAAAAFDRALTALATAPPGRPTEGMALTLAETALGGATRAPRLADAAARALGFAERSADPAMQAETALMRARLGRALGAPLADALAQSADAMAHAQALGNERLLFRIARQRGETAAAMGDRALARRAFAAAFGNLQILRTRMFVGFDRTGQSVYRREAGDFHQTYMRLLLDSVPASRTPDAAGQQRLEEVINISEDLKTIEMEEYFRAECRRSSTRIDLAATRGSRFGPGTAIVYPILLQERETADPRVEMLVIADGRISRMPPIAIGRDALGALIGAARTALEDPGSAYAPPLRAVFDQLFRPTFTSAAMAGVRNIVFIPDGALRNLPLAALMNNQRFVMQDYAVSSLLGITLNVSDQPRPGARWFVPGRSLAMVAGASATPGVRGDWQLKSVGDEVAQIAALFRALATDGDAYLDETFARADPVRTAMQSRPYDVIHISAHAWFDGSSVDAFSGGGYIGLRDEALSVSGFVRALLQRGARYPTRRVELVFLSACRTASDGTDRAPLGIAGAAYRANVATIIATLWPVYDLSADRIARKFYLNLLQEGMGRAEALRAAQRWYLEDLTAGGTPGWDDPGWRHPAFWAPFILIGEPDFPLAARP